jgi:hypothetical protein
MAPGVPVVMKERSRTESSMVACEGKGTTDKI